MSNGPVENYTYSPWLDRPGKKLGYSAVGPGWRTILECLDGIMVNTIENAVANATKAREEYRKEGNSADAAIVVGQIKEKFGGLRVYLDSMTGICESSQNEVYGAIRQAEAMSYRMCEKCGSMDGVETRVKKGAKFGWSLTMCAEHHKERDEE
jgi:hypothetical protein